MAFLKNLKNKIANNISERISDIKENITERVTDIKDSVTNRIDSVGSNIKMVKEIVNGGNINRTVHNLSLMKENRIKDDGTRKDTVLPFQEAIELFMLEKNLDTAYVRNMLSGKKIYKSNSGDRMFTQVLILRQDNSRVTVRACLYWDIDMTITQKVHDSLLDDFKTILPFSDVTVYGEDNQAGATKIYETNDLNKEEFLKELDQIIYNTSVIATTLTEYFEPIFEAKEASKREEQAKLEREQGLSQIYAQNLTSEITIRRVQENFTEDYPYLRMGFFLVQTGKSADRSGGTITAISNDTPLGKIRSYKYSAKVTISGSDTPETLEKKFRDSTGLVIKICYNDENDNRYYISKGETNYTTKIYDLNEKFKKAGYYKADIS